MEADSVSVLNLLSQRPKRWSPAFGRWSDLQGVICIFGLEFEDLGRSGPPHRPLFIKARCKGLSYGTYGRNDAPGDILNVFEYGT